MITYLKNGVSGEQRDADEQKVRETVRGILVDI